jgi:TetR/AcrR family transcriptional repressor of bet genes
MGFTPISTIRRQELQHAAWEVVLEQGYHAMTIEHIARQAGTSKGIVHHYFRSKRELLEYAIRHELSLYGKDALERIKRARTPSERLWGIIDANFAAAIFKPENCRPDITIWDERPQFKRLQKIYNIMNRRTRSNISYALRALVTKEELETIANTISNLIEGCWMLAANRPEMTRATALSIFANYLRQHVPRFDMSVLRLDD